MDIITATSDLATLCGDLSTDKFVAVDTEFMRESTFWPELCLIQIAGIESAGNSISTTGPITRATRPFFEFDIIHSLH